MSVTVRFKNPFYTGLSSAALLAIGMGRRREVGTLKHGLVAAHPAVVFALIQDVAMGPLLALVTTKVLGHGRSRTQP